MIIDNLFLDILTSQAKSSPRLRMNYDLRNNPEDHSQRMLNALEPGTIMPIHRHRNSSETVVMLRGKVKWLFYDDNGNLTNSFIVEAGGNFCGLNVPQGQWHSLESLESGSVIFEAKDGVWEPLVEEDIIETYNNPK